MFTFLEQKASTTINQLRPLGNSRWNLNKRDKVLITAVLLPRVTYGQYFNGSFHVARLGQPPRHGTVLLPQAETFREQIHTKRSPTHRCLLFCIEILGGACSQPVIQEDHPKPCKRASLGADSKTIQHCRRPLCRHWTKIVKTGTIISSTSWMRELLLCLHYFVQCNSNRTLKIPFISFYLRWNAIKKRQTNHCQLDIEFIKVEFSWPTLRIHSQVPVMRKHPDHFCCCCVFLDHLYMSNQSIPYFLVLLQQLLMHYYSVKTSFILPESSSWSVLMNVRSDGFQPKVLDTTREWLTTRKQSEPGGFQPKVLDTTREWLTMRKQSEPKRKGRKEETHEKGKRCQRRYSVINSARGTNILAKGTYNLKY
ncbi:uncharacterized protein VP01_4566g1 [Puccinia sorghi]|uniref:Uncharacterized protein n=1 Tax=Puccinia sorghi TaxID=27349 RepID=A0A0L6UNR1_9BASI|nr:uncharacterized protein VP01_4566g1 [Puccinia sorghi]